MELNVDWLKTQWKQMRSTNENRRFMEVKLKAVPLETNLTYLGLSKSKNDNDDDDNNMYDKNSYVKHKNQNNNTSTIKKHINNTTSTQQQHINNTPATQQHTNNKTAYMDLGSLNISFLIGPYTHSLALTTNSLNVPYFVTSSQQCFMTSSTSPPTTINDDENDEISFDGNQSNDVTISVDDSIDYIAKNVHKELRLTDWPCFSLDNMITMFQAPPTFVLVDILKLIRPTNKRAAIIYDNIQGLQLANQLLNDNVQSIKTYRVIGNFPKLTKDIISSIRNSQTFIIVLMVEEARLDEIMVEGMRTALMTSQHIWIVHNVNVADELFDEYTNSGVTFLTFKSSNNINNINGNYEYGPSERVNQLSLDEMLYLDSMHLIDEITKVHQRLYSGRCYNNNNINNNINNNNMVKSNYYHSNYNNDEDLRLKFINNYTINNKMNYILKQIDTEGSSGQITFNDQSAIRQRRGHVLDVVIITETKQQKDPPFLIAKTSSPTSDDDDRYDGFVVDLLNQLSKQLDFTYKLYVVADGKLGSRREKEKERERWDGMVNEIIEGKADLALGPLTITSSRSRVIDFSFPFATSKLSGLGLSKSSKPQWVKFVDPFTLETWLTIAAILISITLVFFFIDRCTPRLKMFSYQKNISRRFDGEDDEAGGTASYDNDGSKSNKKLVGDDYDGDGFKMGSRKMSGVSRVKSGELFNETSHRQSGTYEVVSTAATNATNTTETSSNTPVRASRVATAATTPTSTIKRSPKQAITSIERKNVDQVEKMSLWACFSLSLSTLLLNNQSNPRTNAGKFLLVGLRMCSLVTVVMYAAKMAASMTTNQLQATKGSLEELMMKKEGRFGTVRNSEVGIMLQRSPNPIYKHLWQTVQHRDTSGTAEMYSIFQLSVTDMVESTKDGYDRVKSSNEYYFLWHNLGNRYRAIIDAGCEMENVESNYHSMHYGIGLKKNSHLKTHLNTALLLMFEDGSLKNIQDKWWGDNGCLDGRLQTTKHPGQLNVDNFKAIFITLVLTVIISVLMCVIECNVISGRNKRRFKKVIHLKQQRSIETTLTYQQQQHQPQKPRSDDNDDRADGNDDDDDANVKVHDLLFQQQTQDATLLSRQTQIF
ncbi:hypothetical protein HELRODRAFT_194512 [Helobdella robusta]|uniref:Ionotropic glutamate receptor C-terminal domain-containing protein n=1 Tax=Helobdella robusta TaxID=6412 RepID=T1FW50_HELRO|nr:hypothetical protein HELRODRAFT_194512 [Helobdella robusta]ESN91168.1 hypothetical protein HELRODRAFT_194512 [Helobdella robusta]